MLHLPGSLWCRWSLGRLCLFDGIYGAIGALRDRGYFSHWQGPGQWVYEERHGYSLKAFILPIENTEPGHWEMFIPDDAKWRATVPDWARDRRQEIALRIAEAWKPKDFHIPDDLKGPDTGG